MDGSQDAWNEATMNERMEASETAEGWVQRRTASCDAAMNDSM